jgi:hypothetical protein
MTWLKDGRRLAVTVRAVIPIEVEISEVAGAGAANPTPVPQPTTSGQAAMTRVAQSMTTLIGVDQVPSVLGSYHVVYHGDAPVWIDGKVARDVIDVTGDVAGADVHFVYKEKRGSAKATRVEGYHVADVDRAVEGGKLQDDYGMAYISWVSWPLDLVVAVAVGGFRSEAAGTAPVDGRTAEVYRLSGKASDDPSGMIASMGLPIQAASGTVWVDQATGALLKATMSYTAQVKDIDGVHGTAEGSLTLEVSKAGQVTVKMP